MFNQYVKYEGIEVFSVKIFTSWYYFYNILKCETRYKYVHPIAVTNVFCATTPKEKSTIEI